MGVALLLDHRGEPIKREQPRRILAKYDAAQTSTENQNHWQWADGMSAAAANSPDVRRKLRERSRYEVSNNCYAQGMVSTYANDVVGVGPQLQIETGDDESDRFIEGQFWRWWQSVRMSDKLRMARQTQMVDGELVMRKVFNPRLSNPVKLDVLLYEGDQVAAPWASMTSQDLSDGIEYDAFGNPVSYTILRSHPGDSFAVGINNDTEIVPADQIIHLFRMDRPGQLRGVPEILAALPLYAQLRRFTLAVIAAAETAADLAGVVHSNSPVSDPDDIEPLDTIDIERRMLLTMPRGWDVSQLKAEQPTTTYAMFKREIIQEQARCISQPYGVAAGDHSGFNYASGKLDRQNYDRAIRVDRFNLETVCLTPLFASWWEFAVQSGNVLPAELSDPAPPPHTWRWEGAEHQDPLKEANAQQTRLESNTTTLAREYARLGLDWEDELRQRAKEIALIKELGLVVEQPQAQEVPANADDEDE